MAKKTTKKNEKNAKNSKEKTAKAKGDVLKKARDLETFLVEIEEGLEYKNIPPLYALLSLNYALTHKNIYTMLDKKNRSRARDIWLRIKESGIRVTPPPMLFDEDEEIEGLGSMQVN